MPDDQQVAVLASAPGFVPSLSPWIVPPANAIPDVTLPRAVRLRTVFGRVVDSVSRPLAGVEVFQNGDSPRRTATRTGDDGRFQLESVPDAPVFLFARQEGRHFLAQAIEPGDAAVELVLRTLDEPPASLLAEVPPVVSRTDERGIALDLVRDALTAETRDSIARLSLSRQILAMLDPDAAIERIENQVLEADPNNLTAVAIARWEQEPRSALSIIDAIGSPAIAASTALELFDRLGASATPDLRRDLLEKAAARARLLDNPGPAAIQLANVADRWFVLGDRDKGAQLVREAQDRAARPRDDRFPNPNDTLAPVLALVDRPAALRLLDSPTQIGKPVSTTVRIRMIERLAGTDPAAARALLDQLPEAEQRWTARKVCLPMAGADIDAAREIASIVNDPVLKALIPAAAARARADSNPAAARLLLRESVGNLSRLVDYDEDTRPAPSVALARLLPLAIRIDPERAPDIMALALSLRSPYRVFSDPSSQAGSHRVAALNRAELAARLSLYDRTAAAIVLRPFASGLAPLHDEFWAWDRKVRDFSGPPPYSIPAFAQRWLDSLPEDPPPPPDGQMVASRPSHQSKAECRLALARCLALPPALRAPRAHDPLQQ